METENSNSMKYLTERARQLFRQGHRRLLLDCIMGLTNSVDCGDGVDTGAGIEAFWLTLELNKLSPENKMTLIGELALEALKKHQAEGIGQQKRNYYCPDCPRTTRFCECDWSERAIAAHEANLEALAKKAPIKRHEFLKWVDQFLGQSYGYLKSFQKDDLDDECISHLGDVIHYLGELRERYNNIPF